MLHFPDLLDGGKILEATSSFGWNWNSPLFREGIECHPALRSLSSGWWPWLRLAYGLPTDGRLVGGLQEVGLQEVGLREVLKSSQAAGLPQVGLPQVGLPQAGLPQTGLPQAGSLAGPQPLGRELRAGLLADGPLRSRWCRMDGPRLAFGRRVPFPVHRPA
ncbi:hypothetical protein BIW11_07875 [Tropilaelaps mercedesae]|uniref:Uncharacterized protein n=1 Tax=Tropilaelaps mercedesae TaxID=418985 RepID=A0A1V9XSB4_9ACAR|nr:hypothetical protein BIW11_07875 [Tropilaelaps mercedesae]